MKKNKVLFVYDVPDWAFHNIALNISRIAQDQYDFGMMGRDEWFGNIDKMIMAIDSYDIVVFLWRFDLVGFVDVLLQSTAAAKKEERINVLAQTGIVVIVYDHLYKDKQSLFEYGNPFVLSDVVATCSKKLFNIYEKNEHLPNPSFELVDGVDLNLFYSEETTADRPVTIGWVGNSKWGTSAGVDLKGYHSVFLPAIEKLRKEDLSFEVSIADRATNPISKTSMPEYYRNIDILVCTSKIEGTPNPVLEAIASGAAVVSTDVGVVSEVLGPKQLEFIVDERTPDAFYNKLNDLLGDALLLDDLKKENEARRSLLSWESRWKNWSELFEATLKKVEDPEVIRNKKQILREFSKRKSTFISVARKLVVKYKFIYAMHSAFVHFFPNGIRYMKRVFQNPRA